MEPTTSLSSVDFSAATSNEKVLLSLELTYGTITSIEVSDPGTTRMGGSWWLLIRNMVTTNYTMEVVKQSRFNILPDTAQVFLDSLHEPSLGDYDRNHQILVIRNRITNSVVALHIITQANWMDFGRGFLSRWYTNYNNMVIRSKATAAVESMTKIYIIDTDEDVLCPICYEGWKAGDDVRKTVCGHEYHSSCIEKWLIQDKHWSCPVCRSQIAAIPRL